MPLCYVADNSLLPNRYVACDFCHALLHDIRNAAGRLGCVFIGFRIARACDVAHRVWWLGPVIQWHRVGGCPLRKKNTRGIRKMAIRFKDVVAYAPIITTICDFIASVLIVSAVIQFSQKRAAADVDEYMEREFIIAKHRTLIALVPISISFGLNITLGIEAARQKR